VFTAQRDDLRVEDKVTNDLTVAHRLNEKPLVSVAWP